MTTAGRTAAIEFRVRLGTVEIWHLDRCSGVLDRELLNGWLVNPVDSLIIDGLKISVDRTVDRDGRIALTLPDLNAWALSPKEEEQFRRRIRWDQGSIRQ